MKKPPPAPKMTPEEQKARAAQDHNAIVGGGIVLPVGSLCPGVYMDTHNYSALVFTVTADAVYYVANAEGREFDVHGMDPCDFAVLYCRHLPAYPVRRCARVYVESLMPKSDRARRVLRHLLET